MEVHGMNNMSIFVSVCVPAAAAAAAAAAVEEEEEEEGGAFLFDKTVSVPVLFRAALAVMRCDKM